MPLDTANKRYSMISFGLENQVLFEPNGLVQSGNRQALIGVYSGVEILNPDEIECPDGSSHANINAALADLEERFEALKRGSCTQGDLVKNQVALHEIIVMIICTLRDCCESISSSSSSSDTFPSSSSSDIGSSSSASVASSSSSTSTSSTSSESVPSSSSSAPSSSSSDASSSSSSPSSSPSSSDPINVACCVGEDLPSVLQCVATFGDASVTFDVFVNDGDGSESNPICWYPNLSNPECLNHEVDPSDPCFWCIDGLDNPDRLNQQMLIPCELCCLKNVDGWDFYITMFVLCKQRVDTCDAPFLVKQAPTKIASGTCDPFNWAASGTVTDVSGTGATCSWSATFTPS